MEMRENQTAFMGGMEQVPAQVYWALAIGSMILSAFFFIIGRRETGLFVGQWPPTFIALALFYKLLRPSREQPGEQLRQATQTMGEAAR